VTAEVQALSLRALERLRALGARFPADLPADLLAQLAHLQEDPAHERRASPRRHLTTLVTVALPGRRDRPTAAWALDRSPGGLALRLGRAVALGEVLFVRSGPSGAPPEPWCPAQVCHCRPGDGGGWVVGCAFLPAGRG
jgi:hypothetical protein